MSSRNWPEKKMWSRYLSSDVFHQLVAPNGQSREGAILKPEKQAIFKLISYDSMMTCDHSIQSIDESILVIKTEKAIDSFFEHIFWL